MTRKISPRAVVCVRGDSLRSAILQDTEGAIAGAIRRVYKHREDSPPPDVVTALEDEIGNRVEAVLDEWLNFGGEA